MVKPPLPFPNPVNPSERCRINKHNNTTQHVSLGRGLFLSSSFSKLLLFSSISLCSSLSIYPSALKLYICIFVFVSSVGLLIFDLYEFLALHITIGRKREREKSASRPRVPNLLLTHLLPVLSVCLSVCLSRPVSSRLDSKGSSEEDYIQSACSEWEFFCSV